MFVFKTTPFRHQLQEFNAHARDEYRGLLFEQRTGKTKVILDSAALLHAEGRINALFVLAPNGVHRNWLSDEVPTHLPDWVQYRTACWSSSPSKKQQAALEQIFDIGSHLRIFTMNIEAIGTKKGFEFAKRFLNATDAMFVVDESTRIKNSKAVSVVNLMKLRDFAPYRRILNGTPVTQGPLDMYSQLRFLSDEALPVQSEVAFRNRYAEFMPPSHPMVRSIMRKTDSRLVPQIIATYKNLEELKEWVDKSCTRVLRKDCADIPEKLYKRWEVEYPPHQQKIVKQQLDNLRLGRTPEPINKLTAVMLYQRLLCGLVPKQLTGTGEHQLMFEKPEDNPRLQAILEIIDAYPDAQIIFWARFRTDLHDISNLLERHTSTKVARYWGDISNNEREAAKRGFQTGEMKYFVGQQVAGGVGLPLHAADIVVYHSNTFSLYHRLQSEDRAEHLAKQKGTLVIDLEVPGTVDGRIISALRSKKDVANLITGDESGEWLT
ncbi:SNF2-related protein [Immundisolibacter sp.]